MGLFKNKKKAIERAKNEKTHEIVCLYCFRNFSHERVMFRALEALDADGYRAQCDTVLDDYRTRFHMETAGELPVVLDPDEFSELHKRYHLGVLSSLTDDYDNITTKRVCPHCHNDIPQSAGFSPSTIISVVGVSNVGKSVYLTSLIHTLKTVTPRNFPIFCTPINSEMGRKFKLEYENPLIENGILFDKTEKQQEPFIFTLSFTDGSKPEINIAFFDISNENMANTGYMDIYIAHIRNSSGMLFLVDPLQFRTVEREIRLNNSISSDSIFENTEEPIELLNRLVEDYIDKKKSKKKRDNNISDTPTAIVLTKTDLLKSLTRGEKYFRTDSHIFNNYTHCGFLNISEATNIDSEIDKFISTTDPNFRNALKRHFANVSFFAVSALGTQPEGRHVTSFMPLRVDEPFLWILYRLGYIEGVDSDGVRP